MAIFSRRASASRLCEAIKAYRVEQKDKLDEHALAVLDRLAGSADAAKAFERLKLTDDARSPSFREERADAAILEACIEAEKLARTFQERISAGQKTPGRLKRLDKAIAEMRSFIAEEISNIGVAGQINRSLDLIAGRIELRRRSVKSLPDRLGATRKWNHEEAAKNAAIFRLARRLYICLGKPHRREVAELAQVILETDVSIERVDNVVRVRRPKLVGRVRRPKRTGD